MWLVRDPPAPASSVPLKMKNAGASRRSLRLLRLLLTPTFSLSFSETAQRVMFRQAPKRKAPATITELARRVFQVRPVSPRLASPFSPSSPPSLTQPRPCPTR